MSANSKELARLLAYDPLDAAGDITGVDYKSSKLTEALGIHMHVYHGQVKKAALEAVGDTTFACTLDQYIQIIEAEGFVRVLDVPFEGRVYESEEHAPEHLYAYWKATEGVLLVFDTWHGHVNGGKFYYNWKPAVSTGWHSFTSSGSMRDGVWEGDHDCREALRFHLAQLRDNGTFVTPWQRKNRLWLVHYRDRAADYKHEDVVRIYDKAAAERIALLPADVRAAIRADISA